MWINSPGGDCVAAAQIYNMLMDYKGDVTVKIDGIAASAASVIAMAGTKVLVSPVSMLKYLESLAIAGKRKSYSKTDKDATFMRMKEDYMNNGQLKPGYNVQIAVESEYIVGVGLFHNPTDTTTLIPFMERIQSNSKRQIRNLIADAGYASEENFTYLEEHGQNAYILPHIRFGYFAYRF